MKVQIATRADIPSWLELASEVEFLSATYGLCSVFSFQRKHVEGTHG
ncbi:MAG: hypothetical protein OXC79_02700 [Candidatus Poribacteria bacterium]|nr:hypothetical protein [Candidatus Poribacteria bacterium]